MTVEIDDTYDTIGDPLKLLPMATCNRCYDLRDRANKLHREFAAVCAKIEAYSGAIADRARAEFYATMESLTKAYADWIADFYARREIVWDPAFPQLLCEQPAKWIQILRNFRESYRKQFGQKEFSRLKESL